MNRIFQMLKIAASVTIPSTENPGEARFDAVSSKPRVTVAVLGVLLMHVILVAATLAYAGFSESRTLHFTSDYHVEQGVGKTRANSQVDTPNHP
jgi:hypothetical protein